MGIYEQLGVRPLINAKGTYTMLSGSLMPPEVVEAMAEAARSFVNISELEEKVGSRLAELTGAEAALVTAGCAAALTQVTAACIAGADEAKIKQLPDLTGLKDEVIIPKAHRNPYDQAIRTVGVKMIEVGTVEEMVAAINPQTAALVYVVAFEPNSPIRLPDMLEAGQARGVPVLVDAAAELPPAENLTKFVKMGADAVMFSGGKGLRGPQASGLVLGKKELLRATALNACPNHSIGRPMKAGKEEIVGLWKAVELYVQQDHEAEWRAWQAQVNHIADALADLPHVETGPVPLEVINHVPRVAIRWDEEKLGLTTDDVVRQLSEGKPRIEVLVTRVGLTISPNTLQPDEEQIIAQRLREILGRGV